MCENRALDVASRATAKTHSDIVTAIMSLVAVHAHVRISDPCAPAGASAIVSRPRDDACPPSALN